MMVYSSFKTACYNWSHVNSPKIRILNRSVCLWEGIDVRFFPSCRPCVRGQRLVSQSSHHRSETCTIVPPNPKRQPIRASSGFFFVSPVYTTENFWHGSGEIGTGPKKKWFGSDKICSVNNLSVPNFIRAEPKFLPVLGPSAR